MPIPITNILRAAGRTPWAIQEGKLQEIVAFLELRANGGLVAEEDVRAFAASNRRPTPAAHGSVAVLPLFGVIGHRMNAMSSMSGGTSTEKFASLFANALEDPNVRAIVLDIDSPGGTVQGVSELASQIYKARGTKPIVAVANALAASAAYWIASAADEIVAPPSGEVGSIGVFVIHTDVSKAEAADGVTHTIIKAGKYKAEGNPYEPLSEEARAAAQEYVDGYYGMFVGAVAKNRGVSVGDVRSGYGEGRTLRAADALKAGMIDRVGTLDSVLVGLGAKSAPKRAPAAVALLDGFVEGERIAARVDAALDLSGRIEFVEAARELLALDERTLEAIAADVAAAELLPPNSSTPPAALPAKETTMPPETLAPSAGAAPVPAEDRTDAFFALAKTHKGVLKGDPLENVATWRASGVSVEQVKEELLGRYASGAVPVVSGVHDRRQDKPFATFGEQLGAIRRAAMGTIDPRLMGLNEAYAAASGGSETVTSDGGFLVQQDFTSDLISHAFNQGEILSRIRKIPIGPGKNGLKINAVDETSRATGSRFGGVQAFWVNEADAATAKKPTFRRIELNLGKLIGLYYATDELLEDTTALEAIAMQAFSEELMFMTEDAIVNGTGVGQPLGVLNAGCLVVQGTSAGGANTIKSADVFGMYSRLLPRSLRNAVWLINQSTWPQLLALAVGTIPVFIPSGGPGAVATIADAPYGTLLGRPILPVEYTAQLGTQGDIILADLTSYVVVDKGGANTAQSIHVRFVNDETAFRFTYRVDGQPWYASAIAPYKGAALTQSPFIAFTSVRT